MSWLNEQNEDLFDKHPQLIGQNFQTGRIFTFKSKIHFFASQNFEKIVEKVQVLIDEKIKELEKMKVNNWGQEKIINKLNRKIDYLNDTILTVFGTTGIDPDNLKRGMSDRTIAIDYWYYQEPKKSLPKK